MGAACGRGARAWGGDAARTAPEPIGAMKGAAVPGYRDIHETYQGEVGFDESGTPVLITRSLRRDFGVEIEADQLAKLLIKRPVAGVARVQRSNPWVIERPRGFVYDNVAFPLEEAIDLTIQLLDRIGRVHVAGWVELPFGPRSLWIDRDQARTLTLVLPSSSGDYFTEPLLGVRKDLRSAALQLTRWLMPEAGDRWTEGRNRIDNLRTVLGDRAKRGPGKQLLTFMEGPAERSAPRSARELARIVAKLSASPARLRDRVESIADVQHVRRRFHWDEVIAWAERELAEHDARELQGKRPDYQYREALTYPLARAYQQRARLWYALRKRESAEADIRRAVEVDPTYEPYQKDLAIMTRR